MSTPRRRQRGLLGGADDDAGAVHLVDHPAAPGDDGRARAARDRLLHAGADQRRLGADQRHRLALHVRSHQGAVGIVILEERDQRRGNRDKLLGRDVDEPDGVGQRENEFPAAAAADQVVDELAVAIEIGVRLRDRVAALVDRRQILHRVGDLAVDDLAVRGLDEAVAIDPREGRERVDQADIGPLRRLDRAYPAVMGRVHVAHLEARALAGKPAGPERRQTALVGDLGQRVGLVHELGELRRAEEFAHRRRRRLGVDQVMRHHRIEFERPHALADGALHAQQTDPVLVLHQLAHRAHAPVAEMVDVVDLADPVLELDQRLDHGEDVLLAQRAHRVLGLQAEPRIHLHPADRGEVVALGIEEERVEHRFRAVQRRRLARAHHPVDVHQRFFARSVAVDREAVEDIRADMGVIDPQGLEPGDARLHQLGQRLLGDLVARFEMDLSGLLVDQILGQILADQVFVADLELAQPLVDQPAHEARGHFPAGLGDDLAVLGIDQIVHQLGAALPVGVEPGLPAVAGAHIGDRLVEIVEHLLDRHAVHLFGRDPATGRRAFGPERPGLLGVEREQERGHRQLAPPVDADMDQIPGVELEIQPRAAIGDDPGGEEVLARRMGLALVMVEENAGRTVHLGNDHALGAVDDEGAVIRHQRHVAHIDVLLLDVADRTRAGLLVDIEDHQPEGDLERRGIGHVALLAFVDVVFRQFELVFDEFEGAVLGKIRNREDRAEHLLQPAIGPVPGLDIHLQELVVGRLLNLDEVRHVGRGLETTELLANAFTTGKGLCHCHLFRRAERCGGGRRRARSELSDPSDCRRRRKRPGAPSPARRGALALPNSALRPTTSPRRWLRRPRASP